MKFFIFLLPLVAGSSGPSGPSSLPGRKPRFVFDHPNESSSNHLGNEPSSPETASEAGDSLHSVYLTTPPNPIVSVPAENLIVPVPVEDSNVPVPPKNPIAPVPFTDPIFPIQPDPIVVSALSLDKNVQIDAENPIVPIPQPDAIVPILPLEGIVQIDAEDPIEKVHSSDDNAQINAEDAIGTSRPLDHIVQRDAIGTSRPLDHIVQRDANDPIFPVFRLDSMALKEPLDPMVPNIRLKPIVLKSPILQAQDAAVYADDETDPNDISDDEDEFDEVYYYDEKQFQSNLVVSNHPSDANVPSTPKQGRDAADDESDSNDFSDNETDSDNVSCYDDYNVEILEKPGLAFELGTEAFDMPEPSTQYYEPVLNDELTYFVNENQENPSEISAKKPDALTIQAQTPKLTTDFSSPSVPEIDQMKKQDKIIVRRIKSDTIQQKQRRITYNYVPRNIPAVNNAADDTTTVSDRDIGNGGQRTHYNSLISLSIILLFFIHRI